MKKFGLLVLLSSAVFAQGPAYPTYVRKPKPPNTRVPVNPSNPSTYMPKGTLYEDKHGQIQRSEGNGQSTNVNGRYRPETFQPVSNPGRHPASGTTIKVTPVKSSTLDVSPL
jgi:hypothetical protein